MLSPYRILRESIEAVPAMKYALAVAGLAAVAAIILGFIRKPEIAVFGVLIVVGFMFIVVVFTSFAAGPQPRPTAGWTPADVLVWFYTVALMAGGQAFGRY